MKVTSKIIPSAVGLLTFLLVHCSESARAGWTGAMNGTGFGQASVNVHAFDTPGSKTRYASTPNMQDPSATIDFLPDYAVFNSLPADASEATTANVKGLAGYIWQANTVGSDGDSTDNPEITIITPADCATLKMTSSADIAPDKKSGTISVYLEGTDGTGARQRGFEFTGDPTLIPQDDPNTPINEFVEFLKTNVNSSLKFDVLLNGPFQPNAGGCPSFKIAFTVNTDTDHLFFVTDGAAKSLPLVISQPADVTVRCDQQPVTYPGVNVYGCTNSGPITVTYNPPPGTSFPVGVTTVLVVAVDGDGNRKTNSFKVTVTDTVAPAVSLSPFIASCANSGPVTVPVPTSGFSDNCGGPVTVTPNQAQVYNGTGPGVTWTFTDAAGNATNVVQPVVNGGLTFTGFYAPIGTVSNSCTQPSVVVVNRGSVAPIKFDVFCGATKITGGTPPTVDIQPAANDCSLTGTNTNVIAEYQNNWHYNWDTTGWPKGTYKVTVNLQDGITKPYVFIKIK